MASRLLAAVILFIVSAHSSTAWSAPATMYVAEFSVSGSQKPEETKAAIQTLLLSRLASEKIMTISTPKNAEITISGSYLLSGSVFSLDAAAVNNAGVVIARAFAQGKSPDELIPAVAAVAKALSEGIERGFAAAKAVQTTTLPPDIVKAKPTVSTPDMVVLRIDGVMRSVAIGRTLPGGERELFVAGRNSLRYYRQGAELKLMAEIFYKSYENVLAVDVADIDSDLNPEIYLTVMDGERLVSQVWIADGTSLKQIAGPLPYFFRAVNGAGGVKKLYAQKISDTADFYGPVSEVAKSGNNYTLVSPVTLPKRGFLYNFAIIRSTGREPVTMLYDYGSLKLFNTKGDEIWTGSDEFGGSETSFQRSDIDNYQKTGNDYRQVFLEQRIVLKANGDLLVPKNSSSWFMSGKHSYSSSSLYCFSWNGTHLAEKWHTGNNGYYLADFAYDEGSRELLQLEVVAKENGILDKGSSRVVIRKVE